MVVLWKKEANLIHFLCSLACVRHFRCDCGNGKFPGFTCTLFPVSSRDGEGRVRKGEWGEEREGREGGEEGFASLNPVVLDDGGENNSI